MHNRHYDLSHLGPLVLVSDLVLEQAGQADTPPADIVLPGRVGHRPGSEGAGRVNRGANNSPTD